MLQYSRCSIEKRMEPEYNATKSKSGGMTMNESQKNRRVSQMNLIVTVAVLLLMILYAVFAGGKGETPLEVGQTSLVLKNADVRIEIPYDQIQEITLTAMPELSDAAAESVDGIAAGTWKVPSGEEVQGFFFDGVDSCICVKTESGAVYFNYSSENETQELYTAFVKFLEEKGFY